MEKLVQHRPQLSRTEPHRAARRAAPNPPTRLPGQERHHALRKPGLHRANRVMATGGRRSVSATGQTYHALRVMNLCILVVVTEFQRCRRTNYRPITPLQLPHKKRGCIRYTLSLFLTYFPGSGQSVCHLRDELDANQAHFLFGEVLAQLLQRLLDVIGGGLLEVVVDV